MTPQKPEQLGICSWSTHPKDPADLLARLNDIGLKSVQLGLNPLVSDPGAWKDVQSKLNDAGISIVSGMFGTVGEDYTSLETIRETGGVIRDEHWDDNWKIIQQVVEVGARLQLPLISSHAGFLPEDKADPSFEKLVDRVAKIAKLMAKHNIDLLFETGQETADTLLQFLDALDAAGATNTGVNFDPANMILYAKGDPIDSLKKLMHRVSQVHIKDATKTTTPGTWGVEVPIGDGDVDWQAFMDTLAAGDFKGSLVIEREAGEDRVGDVRIAIERMTKLM